MFHIVLCTDSLSLPRPWLQKKPSVSPEKFTNFTETYPYLLEKLLGKKFPAEETRVTNFATRASGLASAYAHRLELFSWMEAAVSVIHRGVVDCWPREARGGKPNVEIDKFAESYENILNERRRINPKQPLIVVGIAATNDYMLEKDPQISSYIRKYNTVLKSSIDEYMRFIDMEAAVEQNGQAILHPDGHHLSIVGHKLLAESLSRNICELINC